MKKKIFSALAIAAVAFTSCKEETPTSSELGEATINGSVWAELDLTNTTPEGIEGMQVTVIVDTEDWDQDPDPSYNYEERVYTTTVDANGMYTLTIPATETGYNVTLMFEDVITTRTLADGETENVRVTENNRTEFIYAGASLNLDDQAAVSSLGSNESDTYGSATVYGTVWANKDIANWDAPAPGLQEWTFGSLDLTWKYDAGDAPYSSSDEDTYNVTINADGTYSFTFPTEELGGNGVRLDWGVLDFVGDRTQNNAAGTADSTVAGVWGTNGITYFNNVYFEDGYIETGYDITLSFDAF